VTDTGDGDRPFGVNGNSFVNREAAVQRACDIQNNACSDAVNRGEVNGSTLADCNAQVATCVSNLS
jgi:transcription initiation factor TFIID subunit 15